MHVQGGIWRASRCAHDCTTFFPVCRSADAKAGYLPLNTMNEQMQIAATQCLRERAQRENLEV
jgi:hypothetical protein